MLNFYFPKDIDNNFKHERKNEIRQLLSKYKHGNDIHEHRKQ